VSSDETTTALWSCPDCAFTFDAMHTDPDGGYTCPACEELRLEGDLTVAIQEAQQLRAQRQAVLDLCDELIAERFSGGVGVVVHRIRHRVGAVGTPDKETE
jgi:hypothetical protein